jgi:predicted dehydrogenase
MSDTTLRWGIMSTANIARASFLPALRAAGGRAYAVAGRDLERTRQYAANNSIEHAFQGYDSLLRDDTVDAVYIALPNSLHAEWTIAAMRAGKTILCEKPLCVSVEETSRVLDVARETGTLLWEAFVFPFHPQLQRLQDIIAAGTIGEVREVDSEFHFQLRNRSNIRLSRELGGGALNDVGCYPIHLAGQVFGAMPQSGIATAWWAPEDVDEEMQGVLSYPGERKLMFSCGLARTRGTFSRVIGTAGEVRMSDPFHPGPNDIFEVRAQSGSNETSAAAGDEPSFTAAIRHIQSVVAGEASPRHLAVDDAMGTAMGLALAHLSARSRREAGAQAAR